MPKRNGSNSNLFEVLEYGPVIAWSEEFGLLITANASYLNLWVAREFDADNVPSRWQNVDARAVGEERGLDAMQLRGEGWIGELYSGDAEVPPSDQLNTALFKQKLLGKKQ